jgi:hypothetical protein
VSPRQDRTPAKIANAPSIKALLSEPSLIRCHRVAKREWGTRVRTCGRPRAQVEALNNGVPKIEERRIPAISSSSPRNSDDRR